MFHNSNNFIRQIVWVLLTAFCFHAQVTNGADISLGSISSAKVTIVFPSDFSLVQNSDGKLMAIGVWKEKQNTVRVNVSFGSIADGSISDSDYSLTTPSSSSKDLDITIGKQAGMYWEFTPTEGAKDEKGEKKKKINGTITVYASDFHLLLNGQPSDGKTVLLIIKDDSDSGGGGGGLETQALSASPNPPGPGDNSVTARIRSLLGLNIALEVTNEEVGFSVAQLDNKTTGDHESVITPEKPSTDIKKTEITATEQASTTPDKATLTIGTITLTKKLCCN